MCRASRAAMCVWLTFDFEPVLHDFDSANHSFASTRVNEFSVRVTMDMKNLAFQPSFVLNKRRIIQIIALFHLHIFGFRVL